MFAGRRSTAHPTPDGDGHEEIVGPELERGDDSQNVADKQNLAVVGGARAIGLALEVGRNATWPTVAWKVPGVPWVLDRAYEVIAKNHHRLPGEKPWCEMHPNECVASAP